MGFYWYFLLHEIHQLFYIFNNNFFDFEFVIDSFKEGVDWLLLSLLIINIKLVSNSIERLKPNKWSVYSCVSSRFLEPIKYFFNFWRKYVPFSYNLTALESEKFDKSYPLMYLFLLSKFSLKVFLWVKLRLNNLNDFSFKRQIIWKLQSYLYYLIYIFNHFCSNNF